MKISKAVVVVAVAAVMEVEAEVAAAALVIVPPLVIVTSMGQVCNSIMRHLPIGKSIFSSPNCVVYRIFGS
jgi:hypothetical protein